MLKGIDISYWQGNIDFNQVKQSGIQFIILREGFALVPDKKFFEYVKQIKEVNIPIHGVYHFCYSTNTTEALQ